MKKISFVGIIIIALITMAFIKALPLVVTGTVTDETGQAIAGASVAVKGTNQGVTTDDLGHFSIKIKDNKAVLVISYIGMETTTVNVGKARRFSIVLKNSNSSLDDVVVFGYATQRKSHSMSYSSNTIAASALQIQVDEYSNYPDMEPEPFTGNPNGKADTAGLNREGYDHIVENRFRKAIDNPLSTFSIDVDGASYSNVRRYLNEGNLPPAGAVRIEELINYFHYDYPQPAGQDPFSINTEMGDCPWNSQHKLALIGLQGKKTSTDNLPASNLVFLIDVSGSMNEIDKLPLVKASLTLLVDQLRPQDKVSLVVYAGAAGMVLEPTSGADKDKIIQALNQLESGGSTAGGEGIQLAYKIAHDNYNKNGNNRIILCTDGDFNVGASSDDELERLIEEERKTGVFLSICGFGTGNYQDAKMQKLADKGNGNHSYIDDINEAKKVFVNEFGGTLFTIAKDVKLQIEFNPAKVQGYRLIGYENRMLNKEDFNNDKKDAGELGSGHTVTAIYEIIPAGIKDAFLKSVDSLKYQQPVKLRSGSNETMTIKFRYKLPDDSISKLIVHTVKERSWPFKNALSNNFRFAAAVAEFGLLLRHSEFKKDANWSQVTMLAKAAQGKDKEGYRAEFINLVNSATLLAANKPIVAEDVVGIK